MSGLSTIASIAQRWAGATPSVIQAIQGASAQTGVSFSYLMNKAQQESSFNPTAKASGSSARGLFQFIDSTWLSAVKNYGSQFGLSNLSSQISIDGSGKASVADPTVKNQILQLRNNPEVSSDIVAAMTKDNASLLQDSLGGKVGETDLYLAHFLGVNGAEKFLKAKQSNPMASAADLFPAAAKANKNVFYSANGGKKSLSDVYSFFAQKMGGSDVIKTPSVNGTMTAQAVTASPFNSLSHPTATAILPSIDAMGKSDDLDKAAWGERQMFESMMSGIQNFGSKDQANNIKGGSISPYTAFVLSKLQSPDEKTRQQQNDFVSVG